MNRNRDMKEVPRFYNRSHEIMDTELFDNCNPPFDDLEPEKNQSKKYEIRKLRLVK